MKKKETIRGYLYFIFPVDFVVEKNETILVDCWFNRNFMWLLNFINYVLGGMCHLAEIQNWLIIKFYGKNKKRLAELSKKGKIQHHA